MPSRLAEAFIEITARTTALKMGLSRTQAMFTATMRNLKHQGDTLLSAAGGGFALLMGGSGIGKLMSTAASFEQAMANVRAVMDQTGQAGDEAFSKMEKAAREMGATTQFSATQSAEALNVLMLAGLDAESAVKALPGALQLAAASGVSIAEAASIASKNMKGFGEDTEFLSQINNTLAAAQSRANTTVGEMAVAMRNVVPIAKSLGFEIQEVAGVLAAMQDAGQEASTAGAGLAFVLADLAAESSPAAKRLKKLFGIDVKKDLKDAEGNFIPLVEIIRKMEDAGVDGAAAFEIFGKKGGKAFGSLFNLVAEGGGGAADAIQNLEDKIRGAGNIAERMAKTKLNTFQGKVTILKSAIEGAAIALGTSLNNQMTPVVESLSGVFSALANMNKALADSIVKVTALAGGLGVLLIGLPQLTSLISSVGFALSGLLLNPIGLAIAALGAFALALKDAFESEKFAGRLAEAIDTISGAIGEMFGFAEATGANFQNVFGGIWENMQEIAVSAIEFVAAQFAQWKQIARSVFDAVVTNFAPIGEAVRAAGGAMLKVFTDVFTAVGQFLQDNQAKFAKWGFFIQEIVGNLSDIFQDMVQGFMDLWNSMFPTLKATFGKFADKVLDGITSLLDTMSLLTTDWQLTWRLMMNVLKGLAADFTLGVLMQLKTIEAAFAAHNAFIVSIYQQTLGQAVTPLMAFGKTVIGWAVQIGKVMTSPIQDLATGFFEFGKFAMGILTKLGAAAVGFGVTMAKVKAKIAGKAVEIVAAPAKNAFGGMAKQFSDQLAKDMKQPGNILRDASKAAADTFNERMQSRTGNMLDKTVGGLEKFRQNNLKERAEIIRQMQGQREGERTEKLQDNVATQLDRAFADAANKSVLFGNLPGMLQQAFDQSSGFLKEFGQGVADNMKEAMENAQDIDQGVADKLGIGKDVKMLKGFADAVDAAAGFPQALMDFGQKVMDPKKADEKPAEKKKVKQEFVGIEDLSRRIQESLVAQDEKKIAKDHLKEAKKLNRAMEENNEHLKKIADKGHVGLAPGGP